MTTADALLLRPPTGPRTLAPDARARVAKMKPAERDALEAEVAKWLLADAKANQIVYYEPANARGYAVHLSTAREIGVFGGNRSTKSSVMLAEAVIQSTGLLPYCLRGEAGNGPWGAYAAQRYPASKLRPPVKIRVVVSSLVTAWDLNLKPKLQYWMWTGKLNAAGLPGDPRLGHWGLIPQRFLVNGDWAQSWSEKHRTLTLTNGTIWQVMSTEQDPQDHAQGDYDLILEDELPPEWVHRESRMRVMDRGGQVLTGGTPPDDRSSAVAAAWAHDELLIPGLAGSDPQVKAVVLWTEHNRSLAAEDVRWIEANLTAEQRDARLHGAFLHLAGLILPGFTATGRTWCQGCRTPVVSVARTCSRCGGTQVWPYKHTWDHADHPWPGPADWPTLFYMDPHQSRPTAVFWVKVDEEDRWWGVAYQEIAGNAETVKATCEAFEATHGLAPVWRTVDPKITAQSNQFAKEHEGQTFNIRRAFEEVGWDDLLQANTNFPVAIQRLESAFVPNPLTHTPRLRLHRQHCAAMVHAVERFTWEDSSKRDPGKLPLKEQPARRHSDGPALLRYLAMEDPTWRGVEQTRSGPRRMSRYETLVGRR